MNHPPVWRSLLYVPVHVERFVEKAHLRGADCIQLDLEDSVPGPEKPAARAAIATAAPKVRRGGADVLVRINAPLALAVRDIEAAVCPGVDGLVLTKLRGADHVHLLEELVAERERVAGLPPGSIAFLLLVETPEALPHAHAIAAASPRAVAMSLGAEDFATAIGTEPTEDAMALPRQLVLFAARAAGIIPLGLTGTLAGFADPEAFHAMAVRSRRAGFEGASCINPAQVAPLNAAFTPTADEVHYATRVIATDAEARAHGRGAVALDGRMIDVPVVRRAERLLARHEAIRRRQAAQAETAR